MKNKYSLVVGLCIKGVDEPYEMTISGYPFTGFKGALAEDGINLDIQASGSDSFLDINIRADVDEQKSYYVYTKMAFDEGETWSFDGQVSERMILRQSPHDPADHKINMPKQAFPVGAVRHDGMFVVVFSDNPGKYDNYTTQELDPLRKHIIVSSSDSGENIHEGGIRFDRHYFTEPRTFRFIAASFRAETLSDLRLHLFKVAAEAFSDVRSLFHSISFSANYMHYRKNELGYSDYWIVPGIEYSNKQYTRDAFWQSLVLPIGMEQNIYDAVYPERYRYAENALIYSIWSYRLQKKGGTINKERLVDALEYIKSNTKHGIFRAPAQNGKPTFRSWYDICAFEDKDIITYNQGLYAVAAHCFLEMGCHTKRDVALAAEGYRKLFNEEKGYYVMSRKKRFFTVDALVGDLMHQILFDEPLLPDEKVKSHHDFMKNFARTEYGYKVTCTETGEYLKARDFGVKGYTDVYFSHASPGMYAWGGSYYLYDMLCLLACYTHLGDCVIDDMVARTELELSAHGALHEHMNTVNGIPGKANQGWNAAIYALAAELKSEYPSIERFLLSVDRILLEKMTIENGV